MEAARPLLPDVEMCQDSYAAAKGAIAAKAAAPRHCAPTSSPLGSSSFCTKAAVSASAPCVRKNRTPPTALNAAKVVA